MASRNQDRSRNSDRPREGRDRTERDRDRGMERRFHDKGMCDLIEMKWLKQTHDLLLEIDRRRSRSPINKRSDSPPRRRHRSRSPRRGHSSRLVIIVLMHDS
jgi:hypothetical protein